VGDGTGMRSAILAGGAASRYGGRAKGLERVGGERIIDLLVGRLKAVTGNRPTLIANAEDAGGWVPGLDVVADPRPDCGSLGGLYAAVTAGEGPVLVVAWDMPFVPIKLLEALINGAADYDVFLPESTGRRGVEPLCAVYGPACAGPMAERLDDEDYQALGFHDAVQVGRLPLDTVRTFGDPETVFFNVNTPADLTRAEELWRERESSR
jgi:molybdopterin-guanine dinucleotide biosynthesis protein A